MRGRESERKRGREMQAGQVFSLSVERSAFVQRFFFIVSGSVLSVSGDAGGPGLSLAQSRALSAAAPSPPGDPFPHACPACLPLVPIIPPSPHPSHPSLHHSPTHSVTPPFSPFLLPPSQSLPRAPSSLSLFVPAPPTSAPLFVPRPSTSHLSAQEAQAARQKAEQDAERECAARELLENEVAALTSKVAELERLLERERQASGVAAGDLCVPLSPPLP